MSRGVVPRECPWCEDGLLRGTEVRIDGTTVWTCTDCGAVYKFPKSAHPLRRETANAKLQMLADRLAEAERENLILRDQLSKSGAR